MEQNENLNAYHSDLPYPEIRVTEKNAEYAKLLLEDYAGFVSELTAVNQYFYHHVESEDIDPEIADMLLNISIVEMHHLDVLAKVIKLLGEKPKYYAGDIYWNGDYVYYGEDLLGQLQADLQSELDAIENYQKNIEIIKDPYIVNILKRIILDEDVHVRLFRRAIEKVQESQTPQETLGDAINQAFPNRYRGYK